MPLAEARHNNFAAPLRLTLWNGRKPESLLELLQDSSGNRNLTEPARMSAQQKSNSVDLALYRFAQAQSGNRFDPTLSTHPTFIRKASVRREVGDYTSAVIEGMCICKELSEDKLYAFMEFNFDKINLKDEHQSHVDIIKTMQLHASPALIAIPGVREAFERLEHSLSKLLVPYMNTIAIRRGFSSDHQAMINPLSIDPEIADSNSDSDSNRYYIDPTLELDSLLPEQVVPPENADTVAFPSKQPSATACDSIISEKLAETDFMLGSRRDAEKHKGKGKAMGRGNATATAKLMGRGNAMATAKPSTPVPTAVYDADGAVLGTFTPLRPTHHHDGLSNSPVAESSKPYMAGVPMYQLVQLVGATANQDARLRPQGECEEDYEILSHVRPSLRSHSDSDSSQIRVSKFRPSRQTGQGRTPGR